MIEYKFYMEKKALLYAIIWNHFPCIQKIVCMKSFSSWHVLQSSCSILWVQIIIYGRMLYFVESIIIGTVRDLYAIHKCIITYHERKLILMVDENPSLYDFQIFHRKKLCKLYLLFNFYISLHLNFPLT